MSNKIYITNKTDKPMHATISDNYTGITELTCELQPGANEIPVNNLHSGIYNICLTDDNNDVFYQQKLVRD
jgi:hypothetical protein